MRIMRAIFVFLGSVLLFFSCMLFYASGMTQKLFSTDINSLIVNNIDLKAPIHDILETIPNGNIIEPYVEQKADGVKKALVDNKDFNALVNTYSLDVLHSIAGDTITPPNMDSQIQDVITKHEDEIKNSLGDSLPNEQKDALINGIKNHIQLSSSFDKIVEHAKTKLTPQQIEMIKFFNIFSNPFMKTLSYILMAVSIILIIVMKLSFYRWLLPVGVSIFFASIILYIGSAIANTLLSGPSSMIAQFISTESGRMAVYANWYLSIGGGAILLYALAHFVFRKRI